MIDKFHGPLQIIQIGGTQIDNKLKDFQQVRNNLQL